MKTSTPQSGGPMTKIPADHPALRAAKRAIRRTLDQLTPIQLMRLAATAQTLAYGESRGRWDLSIEWAGQRDIAQPYALAGDTTKKGRAR